MILHTLRTFRDGRKIVALVELSRGDGSPAVPVEIPASALATPASFRRAVLSHGGVLFADDRFDGRDGASHWREYVAKLLTADRRQEAAR